MAEELIVPELTKGISLSPELYRISVDLAEKYKLKRKEIEEIIFLQFQFIYDMIKRNKDEGIRLCNLGSFAIAEIVKKTKAEYYGKPKRKRGGIWRARKNYGRMAKLIVEKLKDRADSKGTGGTVLKMRT